MAKKQGKRDVTIIEGTNSRLVCIESDRIPECMAHYRSASKVDKVYISPQHGYRLKRLTFLKDYPQVKRVHVAYSPDIQVSDLCSLPNLRHIWIADNKQPIDFSAFHKLEELVLDWHPKISFPKSGATLAFLSLANYRPKSKDFTELPGFPNLEDLQIMRAPLSSLVGLGRFKKLKHLKLYYLSKLESIADLDARSVEVLEFQVCRKISDHAHVATLPRLWKLRLSDCGRVPSLEFLNKMPKLRWFSFVNTDVLDGDMTPCFRLEYAGTLNKKHYSHTDAEIDAIIAERLEKRKRKK